MTMVVVYFLSVNLPTPSKSTLKNNYYITIIITIITRSAGENVFTSEDVRPKIKMEIKARSLMFDCKSLEVIMPYIINTSNVFTSIAVVRSRLVFLIEWMTDILKGNQTTSRAPSSSVR